MRSRQGKKLGKNIQPQINADERRLRNQGVICVYRCSSAAINAFFRLSEPAAEEEL